MREKKRKKIVGPCNSALCRAIRLNTTDHYQGEAARLTPLGGGGVALNTARGRSRRICKTGIEFSHRFHMSDEHTCLILSSGQEHDDIRSSFFMCSCHFPCIPGKLIAHLHVSRARGAELLKGQIAGYLYCGSSAKLIIREKCSFISVRHAELQL